jgi:large subunit ribosomal protein L29
MKAVELRQLSLPELKKRLSDERESLANLRFQLATSQLESPLKVRTTRRDIAKLETVIREKEREAVREAAKTAPTTQPQNEKAQS